MYIQAKCRILEISLGAKVVILHSTTCGVGVECKNAEWLASQSAAHCPLTGVATSTWLDFVCIWLAHA